MNPQPVVVHSALLGHMVRADPWLSQGRSSYACALEAIDNADFASAEDYGRLTIQEAQEAFDLFTAWLSAIPRILSRRCADAVDIDGLLADIEPDRGAARLAAGWRAYVRLIGDFGRACGRRHATSAIELLERARRTWQQHHDDACDTICALFDLAARSLGETFVGELWDILLAPMYERSARIYHPDETAWGRATERLLLDIFEATRGHLSGPERDGSFAIVEEADRWVVTFAPCGSGGRTYERAQRSAVTTARHDWAWNTVGVCLYCAHCCQLQQRAPIKRIGFPLRVIDPPVQGQPDPVCRWSIYKDRTTVPDEAYTSVGFSPPVR